MPRQSCTIIAALAAALPPLVLAHRAVAAIVVPMPIEQLADHAGAVVTGRISEVSSYRTEEPVGLLSRVVLTEVEYLKGGPADASPSSLELTVPGGTVEPYSLHVCGSPDFAVGQEWVLFLLPRFRTHPVVGISQGAFRIQTDGFGVARVHTADGRGVLSVPPSGFVEVQDDAMTAANRSSATGAGSRCLGASGVRILSLRGPGVPREALTREQFFAAIRPVLAASLSPKPDAPVARHEPPSYSPVPFQQAPFADPPSKAGSPTPRSENLDAIHSVPGPRDARTQAPESKR